MAKAKKAKQKNEGVVSTPLEQVREEREEELQNEPDGSFPATSIVSPQVTDDWTNVGAPTATDWGISSSDQPVTATAGWGSPQAPESMPAPAWGSTKAETKSATTKSARFAPTSPVNAPKNAWGAGAVTGGAPVPATSAAAGWGPPTANVIRASQTVQPAKWPSDDEDDDDDDDDGWGPAGQADWGPAPAAARGAPAPASSAPLKGWQNWTEEARQNQRTANRAPAAGTRAAVSPQQQSQILNSLLSQPNKNNYLSQGKWAANNPAPHPPPTNNRQHSRHKRAQSERPAAWGAAGAGGNDPWAAGAGGGGGWGADAGGGGDWGTDAGGGAGWGTGAGGGGEGWPAAGGDAGWGTTNDGAGWGDTSDEDEDDSEDDGYGWGTGRHVQFKKQKGGANSVWSGDKQSAPSTYSMPSKTLAHAYKGTTTNLYPGIVPNKLKDYGDPELVDSRGAALQPVQMALFGRERPARERIHWMFPSEKDERVVSLLFWIQSMEQAIGTWGLHKFLQSRERGAFLANADFRPPKNPNEPAFDWLTFDQLQRTRDKIMQESAAFYDPAVEVIVFVFLPSRSGNSVAMWRRKVKVPNNTRLMLQAQINLCLAGLRRDRDYLVHVDEIPGRPRSRSLPATRPEKEGATLTRGRTIGRLGKKQKRVSLQDYPSGPLYTAPDAYPKKKRKWWHFLLPEW